MLLCLILLLLTWTFFSLRTITLGLSLLLVLPAPPVSPPVYLTRSIITPVSGEQFSPTLFDAALLLALYPRLSAQEPTLDPCPTDSPKVIGLLQPTSSFAHHG